MMRQKHGEAIRFRDGGYLIKGRIEEYWDLVGSITECEDFELDSEEMVFDLFEDDAPKPNEETDDYMAVQCLAAQMYLEGEIIQHYWSRKVPTGPHSWARAEGYGWLLWSAKEGARGASEYTQVGS